MNVDIPSTVCQQISMYLHYTSSNIDEISIDDRVRVSDGVESAVYNRCDGSMMRALMDGLACDTRD